MFPLRLSSRLALNNFSSPEAMHIQPELLHDYSILPHHRLYINNNIHLPKYKYHLITYE